MASDKGTLEYNKMDQSKAPFERIQLTEEERKVLVECRRNSLIRGVPFSVLAFLATRFLIQRRAPAGSHFVNWSWIYTSAAALVGMGYGISSYKQRCIDKIMKLEHSYLKDQVLSKRKANEDFKEYIQETSKVPAQPKGSPFPDQQTQPSAFKDSYQSTSGEGPAEQGRTFEEIRKAHREKQSTAPPTQWSGRGGSGGGGTQGKPVKRNKYGDIIYEDD